MLNKIQFGLVVVSFNLSFINYKEQVQVIWAGWQWEDVLRMSDYVL